MIFVGGSISRWYGINVELFSSVFSMYIEIDHKPHIVCDIQYSSHGKQVIIIWMRLANTAVKEEDNIVCVDED